MGEDKVQMSNGIKYEVTSMKHQQKKIRNEKKKKTEEKARIASPDGQ